MYIISWWVPAISDPRNTVGNLGETIWALQSKVDWAGLALSSNCKERLLIAPFSLRKHKKKKSNPTSRAWVGQSPSASCKRNDTDGNEVDWWCLASLSITAEKSVGISRGQCLPWEAATGTMPLPSRISSLESGTIGQRHYLYIFKRETESILQGTLFKWEIGSGFFKVNCSSINRSQEYSSSIDSDRNNVV